MTPRPCHGWRGVSRGVLLIVALWLAPSVASAQNCSIAAVSAVAFGNYNVLASAPVDSDGSVTVQCLVGVQVQIQLNNGMHGTFAARLMRKTATENLAYNLYTTAARTVIWGDGTQGTSIVTVTLTVLNLQQVVPIYGRVPAGQNATAGSYSDTVRITIVF